VEQASARILRTHLQFSRESLTSPPLAVAAAVLGLHDAPNTLHPSLRLVWTDSLAEANTISTCGLSELFRVLCCNSALLLALELTCALHNVNKGLYTLWVAHECFDMPLSPKTAL
jgi:hypothetical protein